MLGGTSTTAKSRLKSLSPEKLYARMEYRVEGLKAVGVPDIAPVVSSKLKPVGKAGEMVKELAVPPVLLGTSAVMACPLVTRVGLV